jgi:hypothetical protein
VTATPVDRTHANLPVDLVDDYVALAEAQGAAIVAVFDTHVQADHVSGLPALVACTAAAAYLPAGAGVEFDHRPLTDGEVVMLGNVDIAAIATPGQALAHHAYVITDRTRGDEPWLVLTGKPYGQRTGVASRADRRDPPPPLGAGSSPRPCPRGPARRPIKRWIPGLSPTPLIGARFLEVRRVRAPAGSMGGWVNEASGVRRGREQVSAGQRSNGRVSLSGPSHQ